MVLNTKLKFVIRVYYPKAHKHYMQTGYIVNNSNGKWQDRAGITCDDKNVEKFDSWELAEKVATKYPFDNSLDIRCIPMRQDDARWLDEEEDKFKNIIEEILKYIRILHDLS